MDKNVDVVILGAGTAGIAALDEVRKSTQKFILINAGPLGTTCARVGCMPSKALIQVANDFARRKVFSKEGILGGEHLKIESPTVLKYVRSLRDRFVKSVMDDLRDIEDRLISGFAQFEEPTVLRVGNQIIRTKRTIIATGSSPIVPAKWERFADKIITTDQLFELEQFPSSLAVIGLGPIGLEIGQALSRLGVTVSGFDKAHKLGVLTDPVLTEFACKLFRQEFSLFLEGEAEITEAKIRTGLCVSSGKTSVDVECVLASLGRKPNLENLGLEKLGVTCDEKGIPIFDSHTMQIGNIPVFIAGEVNTKAAVLHEVFDQGRIAGYNSTHEPHEIFPPHVPMAITFTDPNLARVGMSHDELNDKGYLVGEGEFNFGRSIILSSQGKLRIYGDPKTKKLLGFEMIGPAGEHLAHFMASLIHQGMTAKEALRIPYYHPVVEETLKDALDELNGKASIHH